MSTQFRTGLGKPARIAVAAAIAGIFAANAAMAATCGQVSGTWTTSFNNSVYDCDANAPAPNTGPAPQCSILVSAQACCDSGSSTAEEKTCICAVYLSNVTLLNSIGISTSQCP